MKSATYARRTLKGLLLLFGCGLFYFLSTGPAVLWISTTESDRVKASLGTYLTPLVTIDRRFNRYEQFGETRIYADPSVHVTYQIPQPTVSHKVILGYVTLWGEDTMFYYQFFYHAHH